MNLSGLILDKDNINETNLIMEDVIRTKDNQQYSRVPKDYLSTEVISYVETSSD